MSAVPCNSEGKGKCDDMKLFVSLSLDMIGQSGLYTKMGENLEYENMRGCNFKFRV